MTQRSLLMLQKSPIFEKSHILRIRGLVQLALAFS
jgi:hypothetical protein